MMVRPFDGSTLLRDSECSRTVTALNLSKGKLMVLSEIEAQAHHKWGQKFIKRRRFIVKILRTIFL